MADKNNIAKKMNLSAVHKINFAKIKKLKFVQIFAKFMICIGYVFLSPIFEMISKSIMNRADLIDPSITWIAKHATLDNFKGAVTTLEIPSSLINSIWFSALLAVGQTLVSAMTGFALSRYTFKGRNVWYIMLILAFILPVPLLTVPRVMMFTSLNTWFGINLMNSIWPQLLMAVLGQGTYSTMLVLIFYNFFNMIPKSLDEAAMIDGAGSARVFYHIAIRLSLSTILVEFLFSFVFNWNETYTTSIMLRDALNLLPGNLAAFDNGAATGGANAVNEAQRMAATLISIAPLLLLYLVVQKQFIQGIENTGITGE